MTESPSPIRVLIVDDEPLARRRIRSLLEDDPEVALVGECGNGLDAVEAIRGEAPDVVFLDIQMPELDGFEVVREVGVNALPVVVFVTAHDEHALEAFSVHALDYLLKPVERERFHNALERAKAQIRGRVGGASVGAVAARGGGGAAAGGEPAQLGSRIEALLRHLDAEQRYPDRLAIKTDGRVLFVRTEDIDWIETAGNNLKIHVGREVHLLRATMSRIEQRLSPRHFLRIHRSILVNLDRVRELQPWFQGDYVVILKDGTRLTSGRSYRGALRVLLERAT